METKTEQALGKGSENSMMQEEKHARIIWLDADDYSRLKQSNAELLASCKALFKYIEEGFLVRNIKDDKKNDWALKAVKFVKDMGSINTAIKNAEEI